MGAGKNNLVNKFSDAFTMSAFLIKSDKKSLSVVPRILHIWHGVT